MKLIYESHHFRFIFRRGQYSIFQCCFKENMQECKVRVVCDQKRVYPLDGDHIHFMQATDKSVTSVVFEPADDIDEETVIDEYEVQVSESAAEINDLQEYTVDQIETEDGASVADTHDFREKIKRRLQKALLGKNK
ncbi:modifier of mdg4 [Eurosta solidaginis]|uniref:modifier of mdg4 n=1 Tax=Eurosta solidaginis TaxID=178769 RepID=UPI003530A9B6